MHKEYLLEKLRKYQKENIIITQHAKLQATFRQVDLEEVRENILNPQRLVSATKQDALNPAEEKFDCIFDYGKNHAHRYIITVNSEVVVVTIININRRWQNMLDKRSIK